MGQRFDRLSEKHVRFIEKQQMFFVATAAADGRVNLSPKGMDSLRVVDENRIVWLNVTGSGNETAAHVLMNPRMTLMWCAFEGKPLIQRAYGSARAVHPGDADWEGLSAQLPALPGARQILDVSIDLVQTSCGMAVPLFDFVDGREALNEWAERKGEDGIRAYWAEKNVVSIDGLPTGLAAGTWAQSRNR